MPSGVSQNSSIITSDHTFLASTNYPTALPATVFTTLPTPIEPMLFSDDFTAPNHDASGDYNPVNSRYTASYTGQYKFKVTIGSMVSFSGTGWIEIKLKIYDSLGNLQLSQPIQQTVGISALFNVVYDFSPVYMQSGWYAQIQASTQTISQVIMTSVSYVTYNSTFECTSINGTVLDYKDITKVPMMKYEFSIPMNIDELNSIENNITNLIPFRRFGDISTRYGWIKSLKYNHYNKIANITLISSPEIINS